MGDEVIGVAAGFPTTVNPVLQFGAVPVFVDVDLATHNIDASLVEAAIGPKTKAIMLAHTLGNPFNLEAITALCKMHGLWLVEDCCDALGATYTLPSPASGRGAGGEGAAQPRNVGTFGDIGTVSFYPAHHITMGEGGAVFTNDSKLKRIAESFRDWGRDCYCDPGKDNTCNKRFCWKLGDLPQGYDHKYTYSHLGYNLKISDMQAACALAQMDRLDDFIAHPTPQLQLSEEPPQELRRIPDAAGSHGQLRSVLVRLPHHHPPGIRCQPPGAHPVSGPEQGRHPAAVRRQPHAPALHDRPRTSAWSAI